LQLILSIFLPENHKAQAHFIAGVVYGDDEFAKANTQQLMFIY
jgi:hypothetical protein